MTTENSSPRDINELLRLGTYQGMTDEEVELIIECKVRWGVVEQMNGADRRMVNLQMEQMIADNRASCDNANSLLESIIGRGPVLKSVEV